MKLWFRIVVGWLVIALIVFRLLFCSGHVADTFFPHQSTTLPHRPLDFMLRYLPHGFDSR